MTAPFDDLAAALSARTERPRAWPRLRRSAAVAVVLRPAPAGPEVLLMRRVEREGDRWSGDVACPGGFALPDEALLAAAIRETEEELGLTLREDQLLGRLSMRPSRPWHRLSPFRIAPFVFAVSPDAEPTRIEASEVASARWVPLDALDPSAPRDHFWWRWRISRRLALPVRVPRVWVDDYDVWGLTLRILDELSGLRAR